MTVTLSRYTSATEHADIVFADPNTSPKAQRLALSGKVLYEINRKRPNVRLAGSNETRVSDTGMEGTSVTYRFKVTRLGASDLATLVQWATEDSEIQALLHGRFGIANTLNTAFDLAPSSTVGLKIEHLHVEEDPNSGAVTGTLKLVLDGLASGFS